MFQDGTENIINFFGANIKPTPAQTRLREKKLADAIAYMGDKYRLAIPLGKLKKGARRG